MFISNIWEDTIFYGSFKDENNYGEKGFVLYLVSVTALLSFNQIESINNREDGKNIFILQPIIN